MSLRKDAQTDALFRSILALESVEECYQYFEDLCTVKEIRDLAQRLEVARLLSGGCSYQRAGEKTGASSATIGRVKRCLNYGAGGYALILERMNDSDTEGGDADE